MQSKDFPNDTVKGSVMIIMIILSYSGEKLTFNIIVVSCPPSKSISYATVMTKNLEVNIHKNEVSIKPISINVFKENLKMVFLPLNNNHLKRNL